MESQNGRTGRDGETSSTGKKKKSTKVSRPREEEDTTNEEGTEAVGDQTKERKRPEGVKKAKEALKRGGGEALEAFNNMWAKKEAFDKEKEEAKKERFMATLEAALKLEKKKSRGCTRVREKKAENKGKLAAAEIMKAEADLMKEENAIMFVDKTTLDPIQRQYIEVMQKKIIARRMEN